MPLNTNEGYCTLDVKARVTATGKVDDGDGDDDGGGWWWVMVDDDG